MAQVFLNGRFCKEEEARVSVYDHGFLYGDGVFETLRVYAGRIFRLEAHLARLRASAAGIALPLPWEEGELREILRKCVAENNSDEAVLRLTVSRGPGPPGLDPDLCPTPTLVVLTRPFDGYPESLYREGVTAALVSRRKPAADVLDPGIKSANYLNNILARIEAKQAGADEAILLNGDGFLAEGSVSISSSSRRRPSSPPLPPPASSTASPARWCSRSRGPRESRWRRICCPPSPSSGPRKSF